MAHLTEQPAAAEGLDGAGRRLSVALDTVSAALVAGRDADAAAQLALGLAAGQLERRRVAVVDLAGDTPTLQRLVVDDDPHGITDVFLYGVSLNRVARQLDDDGRLFIVPGGTEPPMAAGLVDDERWSRLAADFRDVGALLLVVAPSHAAPHEAPHDALAALAERLDGVVAADSDPATQALPRLIATAHATPPTPHAPQAPRDAGDVQPSHEFQASSDAHAVPRVVGPTAPAGAALGRRLHPALLVALGLVVVAGLVLAASWIGRDDGRPLFSSERRGEGDAVAAAPIVAPVHSAAPAAADSAAGGAADVMPVVTPPAPAEPPLPVANPRDTLRAAAFAVVLSTFRSESIALASFRDRPRNLAGVTIATVPSAGGTLYHLVTGADRGRAAATATAERLRTQGVARAAAPGTAGAPEAVLRLPYAVQVESGVPLRVAGRESYDSLRTALNTFLVRGYPAYALSPGGGRANIYVGAFADPADARTIIARLQAAGLPAALVVRTGRAL